ncbi:MAG: hypothetical protein IIA59_04285 [Candidatus Marinimicrobia bacterium]|nr:hypothetical protein [Candidatus Neomarinimicrobiota bacterium]
MDDIATLPRIIEGTLHRTLTDEDLKAIFRIKSFWSLYYASLVITGIRPVDLAMLCQWNLNREGSNIGYYRQGTTEHREVSVPPNFLNLFPEDRPNDEPLFPALYSDIDDFEFRSEQLNENLGPVADFLEALLAAAGRPVASLMAFKVTHDEAQQGENDVLYQILISRLNDARGVFEMPQS